MKKPISSRREKQKTISAADLFCGGGGTSTGLAQACKRRGYRLDLLAVNHWEIAIATHETNHTHAEHLCMNVDQIDPRKAISSGKLDLLVASPECIYHSRALGGRPVNDQSRASAWLILRWCEALDIKNVLIENVPEFKDWGPLGTNGKPIKRLKGKTFLAFIAALQALNYKVEWRVLNAANYGDPTTRERLFIMARKGHRKIAFPEPTHTPNAQTDLFGTKTKKWRAAREVIEWNVKGQSIFDRKRPLSPNTMRRIMAGLEKFGGISFVLPNEGFYRGNRARSTDEPLPTVTQRGAGAVVEPFIVSLRGGDDGYLRGAPIDAPVQTITTQPALALIEPFVIGQQSKAMPRSTKEPLPTIAGKGAIALVEPFLVGAGGPQGAGEPKNINNPMPTLLKENHFALVEPFIVSMDHGKNSDNAHLKSIDKPMPVITSSDAFGIVEPYIVSYHGGNGSERRTHSVDQPLPTQDTSNRYGVAQPYLVKYYKTGNGTQSVDEPLPTQTSKEHFGLVEPTVLPADAPTAKGLLVKLPDGTHAILDIRFRMLNPRELAAAMSFPKSYKFAGNREQVVKQIGNAVAVKTAEALCLSLLD